MDLIRERMLMSNRKEVEEMNEWAKYEETEPLQEPTIEERLTETESNVTELQMALCDIYESVGDNNV